MYVYFWVPWCDRHSPRFVKDSVMNILCEPLLNSLASRMDWPCRPWPWKTFSLWFSAATPGAPCTMTSEHFFGGFVHLILPWLCCSDYSTIIQVHPSCVFFFFLVSLHRSWSSLRNGPTSSGRRAHNQQRRLLLSVLHGTRLGFTSIYIVRGMTARIGFEDRVVITSFIRWEHTFLRLDFDNYVHHARKRFLQYNYT